MDDEITKDPEGVNPSVVETDVQPTPALPPLMDDEAPAAPRSPSGVKGFVEMCGRHPFATGLFAILGVIGLMFSVYAFSVDRSESRETTVQIGSVADSLATVGQRIAESAPEVKDQALEVPIELNWEGEYLDNVVFPVSNPIVSRELSFEETEAALLSMQDEEAISSYDPFYSFSISAVSNKGFVQVAPYLLIDVFSVEPIDDDLAGIYLGERGGSAVLREFSANLFPQEGIQVAPLINTGEGDPYDTGVDFLSLEPGEVEEAMLYMSYMPGYYYDFRIGLQVKFNAVNSVVWDERVFHRGVPATEIPMVSYQGKFVPALHPDAKDWIDADNWPDVYTQLVSEDIAAYRRSRVFRFEMAGLDGPVVPSN